MIRCADESSMSGQDQGLNIRPLTDVYEREHWRGERDGFCYQNASGVTVLAADVGGNCN